jgi:hypothetical protein
MLIGFWTLASDEALPDNLLVGTGADLVARSLREALLLICQAARQTPAVLIGEPARSGAA